VPGLQTRLHNSRPRKLFRLDRDGRFAGLFSNPAAMRHLPGPINRSLPARSIMYPSPVNRALCSAGMATEDHHARVADRKKGGKFLFAEAL
jgi:hypothetical protein